MNAILCASGANWVGSSVGSIETALHKLFTEARWSVVMTVYSVTGALDLLPGWISSTTDRGVEVLAIVNRLGDQNVRAAAALRRLALARPAFHLFDFEGPEEVELHAKVVIADEERALIGSSNFSKSGLVRNHEMAVLVEGEAARQAADLVRQLTASPHATLVV